MADKQFRSFLAAYLDQIPQTGMPNDRTAEYIEEAVKFLAKVELTFGGPTWMGIPKLFGDLLHIAEGWGIEVPVLDRNCLVDEFSGQPQHPEIAADGDVVRGGVRFERIPNPRRVTLGLFCKAIIAACEVGLFVRDGRRISFTDAARRRLFWGNSLPDHSDDRRSVTTESRGGDAA